MKCEAISGKHITNKFGYCDLERYAFEGKDWNWEDFCEPCAWALSEHESTSMMLTQTI